jgi:hypothetical protein
MKPFESLIEFLHKKYRRRTLTIVTGSDSSHARSLIQFLKSVAQHEPHAKLFVIDLGLADMEKEAIRSTAPEAVISRFPFEKYPDWFDIKLDAGQYAWKPTILGWLCDREDGPIVWMDAGNILTHPWNLLYAKVLRTGFFSPRSSGDLAQWTHEGVLRYFGLDKSWASGRRNVNGACVAFDPKNEEIRGLIMQWSRLALIREAIAPPGSDRSNHRQDQALLGVLVHLRDVTSADVPTRALPFCTHQDID